MKLERNNNLTLRSECCKPMDERTDVRMDKWNWIYRTFLAKLGIQNAHWQVYSVTTWFQQTKHNFLKGYIRQLKRKRKSSIKASSSLFISTLKESLSVVFIIHEPLQHAKNVRTQTLKAYYEGEYEKNMIKPRLSEFLGVLLEYGPKY